MGKLKHSAVVGRPEGEAADSEEQSLCWRRGRCDTALLGNMGKVMRSVVVRNLREALPRAGQAPREKAAPEINVCCHGQDAGDEVRWHVPSLTVLAPMHVPVFAENLHIALQSVREVVQVLVHRRGLCLELFRGYSNKGD